MVFPVVKSFPTRDLRQLSPTAQASLIAILSKCVKRGIGIFLTQTYRSTAYQTKLYKEKNGKGVGVPGRSMHEFRVAVDIACKGKDLYNKKTLQAAAAIFRSHGWTCGIDWKGKYYDGPHMQFVTLAEQETIYKLKTDDKIEKYLKGRRK